MDPVQFGAEVLGIDSISDPDCGELVVHPPCHFAYLRVSTQHESDIHESEADPLRPVPVSRPDSPAGSSDALVGRVV